MSILRRAFIGVCIILVSAVPAGRVSADADAAACRQVMEKWRDAIVTVQIVVKTTMSYNGESGPKRESTNEATGTMIDSSGLVAMSLAAINPDEAFSDMVPEDFNVTSEITDTKIILADGKELPAKIVIRDRDLDLAFLRPKQDPAEPLPFVDLTKTVKPAVFDNILALYRLGTTASRSISGCYDRIQAQVEKPRLFYVPGMQSMGASLGAPVFGMDSNVVGLLLMRSSPKGAEDRMSMFGGMSGMGMMYIVLPAEDVLEVAKQAPK